MKVAEFSARVSELGRCAPHMSSPVALARLVELVEDHENLDVSITYKGDTVHTDTETMRKIAEGDFVNGPNGERVDAQTGEVLEEARMTYHHTPGHPVADIYEEYLEEGWICATCGAKPPPGRWCPWCDRAKYLAAYLESVATEHPIEAEEGWLGCTDADDDSPGGWSR